MFDILLQKNRHQRRLVFLCDSMTRLATDCSRPPPSKIRPDNIGRDPNGDKSHKVDWSGDGSSSCIVASKEKKFYISKLRKKLKADIHVV